MSRVENALARRMAHSQGPNFSVGFRFLSAGKRQAVYAAYAVCRVADDIVDEPPEGFSVADTRAELEVFEREVEAAYDGKPSHPVTIALAEALKLYTIPKSAFLGLIEGCYLDLEKSRYADFAELEHYCDLVAVTISDISLSIFGVTDERTNGWGRHLAMALQLTNVCRDVGEDTERDRVYLPADEMARFGVSEAQIFERRSSDEFVALMDHQCARAREHFRQANPLPGGVDTDASLGVRLMGLVYSRILEKIAADPAKVLTQRTRLGKIGKARVILSGLLGRRFVEDS